MASDELRFLDLPRDWTCDILDKEYGARLYIEYMFIRTNRMFEYTGLPDTIPGYLLEYMLQAYGSIGIIEYDGDLYAMRCEFGGPPDPYARQTIGVIANPGLNLSRNYRVANHLPPFDRALWETLEPCVKMRNDSQSRGLLPMYQRYAMQLVENDISIRSAQINSRSQVTIVASTGPEIESALEYVKDLEKGKLSVIGQRPFLDGVKIFPGTGAANSNNIRQLLELHQYIRASWLNDVGLESNYNLKTQYVSEGELSTIGDIMLPLVDNMLESRNRGLEAVNKIFGTNISVEKSSKWGEEQTYIEQTEQNSVELTKPDGLEQGPEEDEQKQDEIKEGDENE